MSSYLIFIDTNILLDFYRVRRESGLKILEALDDNHELLVTTYQVEMEFKKNRHAAILETLKNLKKRDPIHNAAFLAESKSAEVLGKRIDDVNKRVLKFHQRLRKVLQNPTTHDPVYKVVQRLFTDNRAHNLTRANKERRQVKRLALRRFLLGYPPRKPNDTSMGDALNWEWLIAVAKARNKHIAIVSRDSDYGIDLEGDSHPNDWLVQEFRDRVSKKRQLRLFTRLAPALKLAQVTVSKEAEKGEAEISELRLSAPPDLGWQEVYPKSLLEIYKGLLQELKADPPKRP